MFKSINLIWKNISLKTVETSIKLKIYHIYAPIARLFVICERSLKKSRWFSPLFGGKNGTQLLPAHCPQQQDETAAAARHLGKMERNALADLDLDATADAAKIRERYTELVKRTHPDTNGGDRSTEHKFQRVVKAYKTLQKAKLV